ncbi:hypothetical protein GW17_00009813 [Ensete ventricosum]|nr:hypothetical protein GW17_00009813 [Ensete ventricosum]RZR76086.1 hypothetical protein BHM03_00000708 [Ensete ventricosum]
MTIHGSPSHHHPTVAQLTTMLLVACLDSCATPVSSSFAFTEAFRAAPRQLYVVRALCVGKMASEAVVFQHDLPGVAMKGLYDIGRAAPGYGFGGERGRSGRWSTFCSSPVQTFDDWDVDSPPTPGAASAHREEAAGTGEAVGRRKRRRTKRLKNEEEVENQRMTHIAVERNRRKQMNEYLAVLRSLMPASHLQRVCLPLRHNILSAINFVKELEQLVHSLEARKRVKQRSEASPLAAFFTFPQYSSACSPCTNTESRGAAADVEVIVIESHANVKIFSRRRAGQLLKLVGGMQSLRLTALHLNVTAVDEMVLYFDADPLWIIPMFVKVEADCLLTSVDEIATAIHGILAEIEEEAGHS